MKPIPLKPDYATARNAAVASLIRAAVASALAALDRHTPARESVERVWPGDRDAPLVLRAATSPISTDTADALVHVCHRVFGRVDSS